MHILLVGLTCVVFVVSRDDLEVGRFVFELFQRLADSGCHGVDFNNELVLVAAMGGARLDVLQVHLMSLRRTKTDTGKMPSAMRCRN